jgi:hypothetical protein
MHPFKRLFAAFHMTHPVSVLFQVKTYPAGQMDFILNQKNMRFFFSHKKIPINPLRCQFCARSRRSRDDAETYWRYVAQGIPKSNAEIA